MSISPAEFLKWLEVFDVPFGPGGGVTYPITLDKGGTSAALTAVANALFYSTATQGALLTTPALSVLGSDVAGALTWSQTLPSGTQALSPATANQVATKAYVDAAVAGLNPAAAVEAASVANLTGYTYNNGASGVGATLTAGSNGVFSMDGINVAVGEPILYKNDTDGGGAYNGVYIVTDAGSVSTPAILTRAIYYDDPQNINDTGIIPVISGNVNQQSAWLLITEIAAVGVSPLTYIQFGQTAGIIPLDKGGTNNNITPSAGGIVYSEALWLDTIAGVAAAGRPLLSGNLAAPTWSPFALDLGGALSTDGSFDFSGAFTFAATLTANTAVTFPTSGTLLTAATAFTSMKVTTYSSAGASAFTPAAGMKFCDVYVTAGGGGGGGAQAGTAPQAAAAGGGGAGSTSIAYAMTAATVGVGQTVTVGAGGAGGAAGANNGSTGNVSSFGALITTNGGGGGLAATSVSSAAAPRLGGAGGNSGSGGSVNIAGGGGGHGLANGVSTLVCSGNGGPSFWGAGVVGVNTSSAGNAGSTYGSGGAGAAATVTTNRAGGDGAIGLVVIVEYI